MQKESLQKSIGETFLYVSVLICELLFLWSCDVIICTKQLNRMHQISILIIWGFSFQEKSLWGVMKSILPDDKNLEHVIIRILHLLCIIIWSKEQHVLALSPHQLALLIGSIPLCSLLIDNRYTYHITFIFRRTK